MHSKSRQLNHSIQVNIADVIKSKQRTAAELVLKFSWADSGCSAKQGLKAMGELLRGRSRIDAVIGPGCR